MKLAMKKLITLVLILVASNASGQSEDDILDFIPPILASIQTTPEPFFVAERFWTQGNLREPISFIIDQGGLVTITHSGPMPLALINVDEQRSIARLEDNSSLDIQLEAGLHVLTPIFGFTLPNISTRTTMITERRNGVIELRQSNLRGGELCPLLPRVNYAITPPLCGSDEPVLDGVWRRENGQLISCSLSDGVCNLVAKGDFLSSINGLPNLIGQPIIRNIRSVGRTDSFEGFLGEARTIRFADSDRQFIASIFREGALTLRFDEDELELSIPDIGRRTYQRVQQ